MSRRNPPMTRHAEAVLEYVEENPGCRLTLSQSKAVPTLIELGLITRTEVLPNSRYEAVQIEVIKV